MPKSSRTPNAARRASFGRAERLQREAGDKPRKPVADRAERAAKQDGQPKPARSTTYERKPTPLHSVEERLARSREAAGRRYTSRLKEQTRSGFNRQAERRRDTTQRAEHDRKRDALQAKARRIEDHQRRANARRLERKRGEMRREFNRAAERRRDAIRRAYDDRQKAQAAERQKELQRCAAIEIDREQKRRAADQQAAERRQTDAMRERHKSERSSFRVNENTAMERHHHAIKGIDEREARALHDFDGRRNGLAGRIAERIPGRRAENDRQRDEIKRGFESDRLTKHRDFEAMKERQFEREQKTRLEQAHERKALMELHRDERATLGRKQTEDRPWQIEDRARSIDRAEQAREQEQQRDQTRPDHSRENIRPSGDFSRAASAQPREQPSRARS